MRTTLFFLFAAMGIGANAQQWDDLTDLATARCQLSAAIWGDSLLFIGGLTLNGDDVEFLSTIEIYNTATDAWETPLSLPTPRRFTAAVTGDSAIYIAGGNEIISTTEITGISSVEVLRNGSWSHYELPDSVLFLNGVKAGSKIIFAGGMRWMNMVSLPVFEASPYVYIYDELTGIWDIDTLSVPRIQIAMATDGNLVFIAGGFVNANTPTDRVDIYNVATGEWTTDQLSEARGYLAGAYANGRFIFAGGCPLGGGASDVIDVYDGSVWTTAALNEPRAGSTAAVTDAAIVFAGGGEINLNTWLFTGSSDIIDVYYTHSDSWDLDALPTGLINHTSIGLRNRAYIAGGVENMANVINAVQVLDFGTLGVSSQASSALVIHPNPVTHTLNIRPSDAASGQVSVRIVSVLGQTVLEPDGGGPVDVSNLPSGIYTVSINHGNTVSHHRVLKL